MNKTIKKDKNSKTRPKKTQAQHLLELAGIWKDRKEMEDSVAYVNRMRGKEWSRSQRRETSSSPNSLTTTGK